MKRLSITLLICFALVLVAFIARAQVKSKSFGYVLKKLLAHNVPEISVEQAAQQPNAYIFLDAREKEEYTVSHLHNARFAGYKTFNNNALNGIEKNHPIIVYCSIGKRSEDITARLIKQGFTNVHNLYGGIFEWMNQGNTVYDMQNNKTQNVHAYNWLWGRFVDKGNKVY